MKLLLLVHHFSLASSTSISSNNSTSCSNSARSHRHGLFFQNSYVQSYHWLCRRTSKRQQESSLAATVNRQQSWITMIEWRGYCWWMVVFSRANVKPTRLVYLASSLFAFSSWWLTKACNKETTILLRSKPSRPLKKWWFFSELTHKSKNPGNTVYKSFQS